MIDDPVHDGILRLESNDLHPAPAPGTAFRSPSRGFQARNWNRSSACALQPLREGDLIGTTLLKSPTPAVDRDRTVSRRSEPSSRTSLTGEQPDPRDPLQPQEEMSRHQDRNSYGRRLLGLRFKASLALTSPVNLPAPGRRQITAPGMQCDPL